MFPSDVPARVKELRRRVLETFRENTESGRERESGSGKEGGGKKAQGPRENYDVAFDTRWPLNATLLARPAPA